MGCYQSLEYIHPTIDGNIVMLLYVVDVMVDFHKAGNLGVQSPVTIGTSPPPGKQAQYEYPPPYAYHCNYASSPQLTGTLS